MTTPSTAAQCPERCLGVEGHSGHHQTSDYTAIRAEARASEREEIRASTVSLYDPDMQRLVAWLQTLGYTVTLAAPEPEEGT